MKSRVFTFISLLVLAAAMVAAPSAVAESSPAEQVYNPNGEVLDVVDGGGETLPEDESGGCTDADGVGPNGGSVTTGSAADCSDADAEACDAADGTDADGNSVAFGSSDDCSEVASVCASADGLDGDGNGVAYGSSEDCNNSTTPTVSEGELPFTGFEAGLVALAGLALLGGGFAMRRFARHDA